MDRTVGVVARAVGISAHTIRYYERIGLIPDVARDAAGRQLFDDAAVDWLFYVVCLRRLGMGITQIRQYVESMTAGTATSDLVDAHLAELRRRRNELDHYIELVESKLAVRDRP